MKQHRPRVSEYNYRCVMSHLTDGFGENKTFDNALWVLIDENESLKIGEEYDASILNRLEKELSNTTDLLIAETKRAQKMQSRAIAGYILGVGLVAYIGLCL